MVESRSGIPAYHEVVPEIIDLASTAYPDAFRKINSLRTRDKASYPHSFRTAAIAVTMLDALAEMQPELGITEEDRQLAVHGGLFHDIGKSETPSGLKREEYRRIHMEKNLELCKKFGFPSDLVAVIMYHHDFIRQPEGARYPSGPTYRRVADLRHEERRQTFPPNVLRVALIVWFADKLDRMVNGYQEGGQKTWEDFSRHLESNFPPEFHRDHPDLIAAAGAAVNQLFYRY